MLLITCIALRVRKILETKNESCATVFVSLITFASPKSFTVPGMFWNAFRSPSFVLKQSACRMLIPRCILDKRTTYFHANTCCYDKEIL